MGQSYNARLETETIAGVFHKPSDFINVASITGRASFMHPPYRFIWEAFEELDDRGIDITLDTVGNHLERTGKLFTITVEQVDELRGFDAIRFLYELPEASFDGERPSLESLAKQLQDVVATKELQHLNSALKSRIDEGDSPSKIVAFVDAELGKIAIENGRNVGSISDSKTATKNFFERFQAIVRGEIKPFIETGLDAIDEMIGGIGKGKVILISGTSGDGKTVFSQNILSSISIEKNETCLYCDSKLDYKNNRYKCPNKDCGWSKDSVVSAFIKMEGREHEAWCRFAQITSGVDALDIERGKVSEKDMPKLISATKILKNGNVIMNASPSGLTMRQLKNQMMKLVALGAEVILIDQLNNLELETDKSSYLDADKKGYLIKKWAEELDVGVIAIHQLNKSTNSVHRKGKFDVSLADLAESGEKAMDAVFFVRYDENMTLIMCVKARVGKKGNKRVNFDYEYSKYTNWTGGDDDIPDEFGGDIND